MDSVFYRKAAQTILSFHQGDLPDLRGCIVLIPNNHVAQCLARALIEQAGVPALLLPFMVTLSEWVSSVEGVGVVETETQRVVLLYQILRDNKWFEDADRWGLSRELLSLIDELSSHSVLLPNSPEEFSEQLIAAYAAREGRSLQFEAQVVHELWYAMAGNSETDAIRNHQQCLAQLANQISLPLYVLQTSSLSAPDRLFLERCAARVRVTYIDTRALVLAEDSAALLACALQRHSSQSDLRSDAMRLTLTNQGRLSTRMQFFAANNIEQEARAADVQIRRWLLAGKQSIAVVVQDRLVARRVQALLARAQIQVKDETGWTFSTLSASTVLMTWLDTLQNDFYYLDVLDLLKSPFLFADQPLEFRKQVAYYFEQLVRKNGLVNGLDQFIAANTELKLNSALERLSQAARLLPNVRMTLSLWLHALLKSLDQLGVLNAWSNDPAGLQLLQLLGQWRDELHQDDTRCSFSECKRWLSQQLDLNTFRDISIESPVLFTHLAATRWRCFDAVVLLGCDTQHLPAPSNNFWFNDSVRTALGLPSSSVVREAVRDDLLGLLAINDDILVTWPARKNGELNLLSPYFELIRVLHVMSYGDNLAADELGRILDRADVQKITTVLPDVSVMPEPVIMPNLLPQRISPSGYNSLVACPYQYFSRYVLRLNELDEVREVIDKRDYGTWIHAVLHRFHNTYSLLLNEDRTRMESELHRISIDVFSDGLQQDYLTQAWMQAWQALIPIYVEWQLQREKSGWRYLVGEEQFEVAITQDLTLYGRIDRVDQHMDPLNSVCVLDYKTQSESGLKRKLIDPGEDVQLPCYVYARGGQHAVFVSLAENDVQEVEPKYDVTELVRLNTDRLVTLFSQLRHGAALPANGVQAVCDYCEMRGLCRQGGWELDSIPHSLSHLDSVGGQLKALGNPEQGPLGEAMRDEDNHE